MAPRGLKKILKDTVPAKLTGKGKYKGFEILKQGKPSGTKLRGLTKALEHRLWWKARCRPHPGTVKRGGWKGQGGGRKRGTAVDAQLTAGRLGQDQAGKGQYADQAHARRAGRERPRARRVPARRLYRCSA